MDNLLIWNWILFVVHLLLGIGLLIYFMVKDEESTPMDFALYNIDIEYDDNLDGNVTANKSLGTNKKTIQYMIIAFFLVTAFFHLLYATNGFGTGLYLNAIKNNNNYFRWMEYAISATIMIVIINLISGVKSLDANILSAISAMMVMLQGNSVEVSLKQKHYSGSKKKPNRDYIIPTVTGWVLLTGIFAIIIKNFFQRISEVKDAGFNIPSWIPGVIFPTILWYVSFGIVQLVQISKGGDYRKYEYTYLILSLLSKAFLGIYLAFGLTQREDTEDTEETF